VDFDDLMARLKRFAEQEKARSFSTDGQIF
jgi:hypothetical protein